jgi:DNA-directed RNA polymerase specialized sigma24 family protein
MSARPGSGALGDDRSLSGKGSLKLGFFVSALRRMRETEQPLNLKPWLYQIARNGCIAAFRRSKGAEEVSYDADEGLAPADHSRLVGSGPSPDAAVAAK